MGLSADLSALAPLLEPTEAEQGGSPRSGPRLCPRLVTTYSPRVHWPRPERHRGADWQGHDRWRRIAGPWPQASAPGLVSPAKSVHPLRHGLSGLTSNGRREIWRSLKLLEEHRAESFFWTITLPDEALAGIERLRGWSGFQDRVRHELVRLLQSRLGFALVCGVAEVQPRRLRNHGTFAPHLHVAFVGKRRGWHRWAFDHDDLDGIIERAAVAAGAPPFRARSAGEVKPVRASVAAYMAKYMTKGSQALTSALSRLELVPRQWWFRSQDLLRWVQRHITPISLRFLAWVHENRRVLEDAGFIRHRQVVGLPESAPLCWRVDWRGPPQLAALVALWHEWSWDAEWRSVHDLLHVRHHPCQHPFRDQHV